MQSAYTYVRCALRSFEHRPNAHILRLLLWEECAVYFVLSGAGLIRSLLLLVVQRCWFYGYFQ